MNKTIVIILGLTVGLLSGLLVFSLNYFSTAKKAELPKTVEISPTPVEEKITHDDPAGFTFSYPKSLTLNPHDEDQENYAHLELTSTEHPGNIIVWAKDTNVNSLESLMKQEKVTNAIDTTLGEEPAKKYMIEGDSKIVTLSALHEGYLYQITVDLKDNLYWNPVANDLALSFKFKPPEQNSGSDSSSGEESSGTEYLDAGEEVIE